MNVTHHLMIASNRCRYAVDSIEEQAMRESVENGLRAMQIAWAQADALLLALERKPSLH